MGLTDVYPLMFFSVCLFFIKSDVKNKLCEGKIFTTSNYSPGIVKKKSSFYCVLQPRFTFFYIDICFYASRPYHSLFSTVRCITSKS